MSNDAAYALSIHTPQVEVSETISASNIIPIPNESPACVVGYWGRCPGWVKNIFSALLILPGLFFLSWAFFLRFLDQYKRYVREIILTFIVENEQEEDKN